MRIEEASNLLPVEAAPGHLKNVVVQIADVPLGQYEPLGNLGIPDSFSHDAAVIFTGEATAAVLVAVDVAKHRRFDLERRILEVAPSVGLNWLTATKEIVRGVHLQNEVKAVVKNTDVENRAWAIVNEAIAMSASDLHIETRGQNAEVYARVYGELVKMAAITTQTAMDMCNVLYSVHADEDNKGTSWNEKEVLDTVIPHTVNGVPVQLRFSSGPIHPSGNFHAVFRLLVMEPGSEFPLEDVYTAAQVEAIEEMLMTAHGVVVLVGPTNSGKSTTMQALIRRVFQIRGSRLKVISVEQPVEYIIPGACQISVNEPEDFNRALKGTLRQDPDAAVVGEIRDEESAEQVKHLGLAGRKLFSTLHLNHAMAIFARLRELGIPDSVLYMPGFIAGVICQRLVPRLCDECSIPIEQARSQGRVRSRTYERVAKIARADDNIRVRGDGCPACNNMGIVGRAMCAEVLTPDELFLEFVAAGRISDAKRHWEQTNPALDIDGNGLSMVAHAIQRLRNGEVDPSHVETYVGKISSAAPEPLGA